MTAQVFFNVTEAAQILDIHPESVRRTCRAGKIHYGRIGKNYRFTMEQLKAYVELNGSVALQQKIAGVLEHAGR